MDVVLLLIAFVVILLGAELFTNGIEWFGHKLELAEGAVGSVLAAVGTALPETMVPLIAILFAGGAESADIGIGAILGAPFMIATLAMFVTAVAFFLLRRKREASDQMLVSPSVLWHDVRFFFVGYAIAIGAAFLPLEPVWPKWIVGLVLLGMYAYYVREHFVAEAGGGSTDLAPLRLRRLDRGGPAHHEPPRLRVVNLQVLAALTCIVAGAWVFVGAVERLAGTMGVDGAVLALIVAPIATELPEKANSVLWVRQRKDTLALGNLTGAMVFQSMIPTAVALFFASSAWSVAGQAPLVFGSAIIAFVAAALIYGPMRLRGYLRARWLLVGGALYFLFVALVLGSGLAQHA